MTWYCKRKPISNDMPDGYISGLFCTLSDQLGSDMEAVRAILDHEMDRNRDALLKDLTGLIIDIYAPGGEVDRLLTKWSKLPTKGNFEKVRHYGNVRVAWRDD